MSCCCVFVGWAEKIEVKCAEEAEQGKGADRAVEEAALGYAAAVAWT